MNDTLNAALALHSAGISVIPLGENKVPLISWREFCDRQPTRAEIEAWFARPAGLARVCGAISGNLETIDFDVDGEIEPSLGITADSLCREWGAIVEEARPGLLSRLTVIATPRPGWHVSYRCTSR